MKNTLLSVVVLSLILPAVLIAGFFYIDYNERLRADGLVNVASLQATMNKASFNFDKQSSMTPRFSLDPSLSDQPVPTNKWWQNATVAQTWPDPLYNLPLTTTINASGLGIGAPNITVSSDGISGAAVEDVTIKPDSSMTRSIVKGFDDVSVRIGVMNSDNEEVYDVTLAKGVPFVYANFHVGGEISIDNSPHASVDRLDDGRDVLRFVAEGKSYAIYTPSAAGLKIVGGFVTFKESKDIVVASLPSNPSDTVIASYDVAAASIITGGSTRFVNTDTISQTTITYQTSDSKDTIIALLPHHRQGINLSSQDVIGEIATVRGTATLIKGSNISYNNTIDETELLLPKPEPSEHFSIEKLEKYLQEDLGVAKSSTSSYDASKELFRLANLTMIARQVESSTASVYQERLKRELVDWLSYEDGEANKYFYYDKKVRGLVAAEPQYGSEEFNDHHFHYGYFLYAAAVLGTYDKGFVEDYGAGVTYIGEDIASSGTDLFPRFRTFDVYEGHSWAGGLASFRDGNNQESVSEAVHAWYALAHWAEITGNREQYDIARWLFANESKAALTYYYESPDNPFPEGYEHSQMSMVWGGKSVWSTWFSPEEEAKHAIITLPLTGGSGYLVRNEAIRNSITELEVSLGGDQPAAYRDILLLGMSLYDPAGARSWFSEDMPVDNSNSLSYIYYYLAWAEQR